MICNQHAAHCIENAELGNDPSGRHILNSQFSILNSIEALVDKSLLRQAEGAGGESRFVMLETIREYALERLAASAEAEAIRRRHAEYYLALAERSLEEDHGNTEVALFDQFEQDLDNLRAALDWSHTTERAAEIEVRLSSALTQFWAVRGYASEGWERLKAALARRSQVEAGVRFSSRTRQTQCVSGSMIHFSGSERMSQADPAQSHDAPLPRASGCRGWQGCWPHAFPRCAG